MNMINISVKPQNKIKYASKAVASYTVPIIGFILMPAIWIALKQFGHISDRYLPSPADVLRAATEIDPNIIIHVAVTAVRLVSGFLLGVIAGIALGIAVYNSQLFARLISPALDSMRSIPAIAIVPFFILWFGFTETGRISMVVTGIAFNIAIAAYQALKDMPEKHKILFKSFGIAPRALTREYVLPRLMETLLPTVRFSLSTAMGVVIASELLGSQIGLGYLMQTARSTFSMHVIFLATIILGLLNALVDAVLTRSWNRTVYWR
jgi:ABC-type nitrate/sulfonate/bicarbonate transport system permease component